MEVEQERLEIINLLFASIDMPYIGVGQLLSCIITIVTYSLSFRVHDSSIVNPSIISISIGSLDVPDISLMPEGSFVRLIVLLSSYTGHPPGPQVKYTVACGVTGKPELKVTGVILTDTGGELCVKYLPVISTLM